MNPLGMAILTDLAVAVRPRHTRVSLEQFIGAIALCDRHLEAALSSAYLDTAGGKASAGARIQAPSTSRSRPSIAHLLGFATREAATGPMDWDPNFAFRVRPSGPIRG